MLFRKVIAFILLLAFVAPYTLESQNVYHRRKAFTSSGSSALSDDFNRSDSGSIGANWTEESGTWDIASETLEAADFAFGDQVAVYSGSTVSSVNQWVKWDYVTSGGVTVGSGCVLRFTDDTSAFYVVRMDDSNNLARWYHWDSVGGTETQVDSSALTVAVGDTYGVTIDGTGSSTTVRIWVDPTGEPTTASNWNGDTTPDITLTDDPSSAVDTGSYVGLYGQGNGEVGFDNFFAEAF